MPDNLPARFIAIIDHAEAILGEPPVMGNLAGNLKNVANQLIVRCSQIESCANMFARHNQEMIGSLGVDVFENNDLLVLIDSLSRNLTGNNFTEDAVVRHALLLHQGWNQQCPRRGGQHATFHGRHVYLIQDYD